MNKYAPTALLLLPIATLFIPVQHLGGPFNPNSFLVFATLGGLLFIGSVLSLGRVNLEFSAEVSLCGLLPLMSAVAVAALILYHGQQESLSSWVPFFLLVGFSFFYVLVSSLLRNEGAFNEFEKIDQWLLGFAVILSSFSALGPNYFNVFSPVSFGFLTFPPQHGGFNQPNVFASFISSILAISLWANFYRRQTFPGFYTGLSWLLLYGVLALVGSRTAHFTVYFLVAFWLVWLLVNRKTLDLIKAVFLVCLGALVGWVFVQISLSGSGSIGGVLEDTLAVFRVDDPTAARLAMLKASLAIGLDSWVLGHGFGNFQFLFPNYFASLNLAEQELVYQGAVRHPHNEIANWWVSGGSLGLLFVLGPMIYLLIRSVGWSWRSLPSFTIFVPIGFHSLTEFPLYSSAVHWILLLCCLVWVVKIRSNKQLATVSFESPASLRLFKVGSAFIALLVLALNLNGLFVGKNLLANAQSYAGSNKVEEYVRVRSAHPELNHWAYGEDEGHKWIRSVFQLAMKEGNGRLVSEMLPKMKNTVRYINSRESWSLYAGALAGLGKKAELIGFIDYIEKLDPKYANGMRQAYGL